MMKEMLEYYPENTWWKKDINDSKYLEWLKYNGSWIN
jgi:hypothetical protein